MLANKRGSSIAMGLLIFVAIALFGMAFYSFVITKGDIQEDFEVKELLDETYDKEKGINLLLNGLAQESVNEITDLNNVKEEFRSIFQKKLADNEDFYELNDIVVKKDKISYDQSNQELTVTVDVKIKNLIASTRGDVFSSTYEYDLEIVSKVGLFKKPQSVKDLEEAIKAQENLPDKEKLRWPNSQTPNPSVYPMVMLIYGEGTPDIFTFRWNPTLDNGNGGVQVAFVINKKLETENEGIYWHWEWLTNPILVKAFRDKDGIFDYESEEVMKIINANSEDEMIEEISKASERIKTSIRFPKNKEENGKHYAGEISYEVVDVNYFYKSSESNKYYEDTLSPEKLEEVMYTVYKEYLTNYAKLIPNLIVVGEIFDEIEVPNGFTFEGEGDTEAEYSYLSSESVEIRIIILKENSEIIRIKKVGDSDTIDWFKLD